MLMIIADITDPKNIGEVTAGIVAFFVQFIPLIAVIFSIKMAGGIVGRLHQFTSAQGSKFGEFIKGNEQDPDSMRNVAKRNMRGARVRSQAQQFRTALGDYSTAEKAKNSRGMWTARRRAMISGRGNILAKEAMLNKEGQERLNAVKNFGDDTIPNARTAVRDEEGVLRTLDGKPVSSLEQDISKKYYRSMGDVQAINTYRETKDLSNEDAQNYIARFGKFAEQEGWTPEETMSQWMGTAFARQDERGELKHGSWKRDTSGKYIFTPAGGEGSFYSERKAQEAGGDPKKGEGKADSFVNDTYYKKGSFKGSSMLSSHPRALLNAKKEYVRRLNTVPDKNSNEYKNAEARLRQILEIEEAFKTPMLNTPEQHAGGGPQYVDRMAGASPATIAAFNELTSFNSQASAGAHPYDAGGYIAKIQSQIKGGTPQGHETIREQQIAQNAAAVAATPPNEKPNLPHKYVP